MPIDKSQSNSGKMSTREAFKLLNLSRNASIDEINQAFQNKLADIHKRNADKYDQLATEASSLYKAYSTAYMSKDAPQDQMLALTLSGPDDMLNSFGIPQEIPHTSLKVQMQSQAQYKDGQLVKKESTKTESFINKDGKREMKTFENGKLIKHTIDGQNMLK